MQRYTANFNHLFDFFLPADHFDRGNNFENVAHQDLSYIYDPTDRREDIFGDVNGPNGSNSGLDVNSSVLELISGEIGLRFDSQVVKQVAPHAMPYDSRALQQIFDMQATRISLPHVVLSVVVIAIICLLFLQ